MTRCTQFPEQRHQRYKQNGLELDTGRVTGSFPFLNPTHARFNKTTDPEKAPGAPPTAPVQFQWRSRDNRKGRHTIIVPRGHHLASSKTRRTLQGIGRMFTTFAVWDVSWWIAVLFSIGSAIFIVCGLFYWLPLAYPETAFTDEAATGGGVASFVGATFFQVGAILLVFESVNENQTGCFGWAIEELFITADPEHCEHHHQRRSRRAGGGKAGRSSEQQARRWTWWPSWQELKGHYFHELGFIANVALAIGATIFYVTGIMSLPGVYDKLGQGVLWGVYWLTYLIGGVLFVFSSGLYMLETQEKWWKPAWHVLGWHIGLWNMIGSVGWTLSASFGYCNPSWCEYQSDLTLLWASFAFLVGSLVLWFEALDKYSVETG